ncbi:MAG: alpha/beta hydrolase [Clostridia bacterium]|nr:alpha/beta hydrolase [Clostridia bacterium]
MKNTTLLWNDKDVNITIYKPEISKSDCIVVIFPGGGYCARAWHEGEGYAEFFSKNGIISAVVDYRVYPDTFPAPLADAQRAIQFVRNESQLLGIDKNKVAVMGSSAGGHLAALVSTYNQLVYTSEDEISKENFKPNAQILCYPVIDLFNEEIRHLGSAESLLGNMFPNYCKQFSPNYIADKNTPQAFIWHTFEDTCVNVLNSIEYVKRLKQVDVNCELHIFPKGEHGCGLYYENDSIACHNREWSTLLLRWLQFVGFYKTGEKNDK